MNQTATQSEPRYTSAGVRVDSETPRTDLAELHVCPTAEGVNQLLECSRNNELACYAAEAESARLRAALELLIAEIAIRPKAAEQVPFVLEKARAALAGGVK